jgi:protein-disulfide isomerase
VAAENWGRLASLAGVKDTAALALCVEGRNHLRTIDADIAAAHSLNLEGTPGVVINDSLYRGTMTLDVLERRLGFSNTGK